MDDDCEEIYTSGLLKRYCKRPAKVENVTLVDWAAWYDRTGKPYVKLSYEMDTDGFPSKRFVDHFHNDDNEGDEKEFSKAKKRNKARIIRSVWFNKEAEPEKHYREILMLFTSWRNEETDLIGAYSTFQERYRAMSKSIDEQMKQYAVCNEGFNQIQLDIVTLCPMSYRNYHKTTMTTRFFASILTSFLRQQHMGFFRSHNNISPGAGPSPSRSTCYTLPSNRNVVPTL